MRAVSLFSGGLDSILAARIIADQGIGVEALYFRSVFWGRYGGTFKRRLLEQAASQAHARLRVIEIDQTYFDMLKNPDYGYGKNLNPCIDCRIFMIKKAAEEMNKRGAAFLVTGEVLGQRPMSQYKSVLARIEKRGDVPGLIVRPLSAKLFPATVPEKMRWIDRDRLFDIQGRSRKRQLALAKSLGIRKFPNPAGGCLLTDKGFSDKMRDIIKYGKRFTSNDIELIKSGRVFRLSPEAKLVVGRDKNQNSILSGLATGRDYIFKTEDVPGPVGIGRGSFDKDAFHKAASIIARYSDSKAAGSVTVFYTRRPSIKTKRLPALPAKEEDIKRLRV